MPVPCLSCTYDSGASIPTDEKAAATSAKAQSKAVFSEVCSLVHDG